MKNKNTFLAIGALIIFGLLATIPAAQADTSRTTRRFIENVSVSNLFEIESSRLALNRSENPPVRDFAHQMIEDHTEAGEAFEAALAESMSSPNIAKSALDSKHRQILNRLQKENAANFDEAYVQAQLNAHQDAVSLFRSYAQNGDDPALRDFAAETLPTLENHYYLIKDIRSNANVY